MIYSSTDIYGLLSGNPVISAIATIKIVEGRPSMEVADGVVIYIAKYPLPDEFEVTWSLWIIDFDGEPLDVLFFELKRLLPKFQVIRSGEFVEASVTELKSIKTELKPQNKPEVDLAQAQSSIDFSEWEERFLELQESIEDRMLLVSSGRPGKDGRDGRDGKDGRDGVDMVATSASLGDLTDVQTEGASKGQYLAFDGEGWVPKEIPQTYRAGGSGGRGTKLPNGGDTPAVLTWDPNQSKWVPGEAPVSGIPEAPMDGRAYVRLNGEWVDLQSLVLAGDVVDGGNFTTGTISG